MARNYYSEIHLHVVWHTKQSAPLLTPDVEPFVHQCIRQRLIDTPGAFVHQIGGTENHIHVCLTIAPTIRISELVGALKGASSHEVNQRLGRGRKLLQWQSGYGVVSFGTKDRDWVIAYVRNQRQHHARGTAHERLERQHTEDDSAQADDREAP
jgi:putative transposase